MSALDPLASFDPLIGDRAVSTSGDATATLLRDEVCDAGPVTTSTVAGSSPIDAVLDIIADQGVTAARAIDRLDALRDRLEDLADRLGELASDTTMSPREATDVATTFGASFFDDPERCVDAFLTSLVTSLGAQIVDLWTYLAGVARWALRMSACADKVTAGLEILDLDAVSHAAFDDADCEWIRTFVAQTLAIGQYLETLEQELSAWAEAVSGQPGLILDAIDVLLDLEENVLEELFGGESYYQWLKAQAADAPRLCGALGTIHGFVVFQLAWIVLGAAVAELGPAGRVLWELSNAPLPSLPADGGGAHRRRSATRAAPMAAAAGAAKPKAELSALLAELGPEGRRLLKVILKGVADGKQRLTRRITNKRLRVILLTLEQHSQLALAAETLQRGIRHGIARSRFIYGPHGQLLPLARHLNNGINGTRFLELIKDGVTKLDHADELIESAAQLTRVFERAHAIDQRLWPHVKPILQAEGIEWETVDDVFAMLLPAADHTGNPLRSLARASGLSERELGRFNEYKSLTGYLLERVLWDQPPPKSLPAGSYFVLTPKSSAREVVDAHEKVWMQWAKDTHASAEFNDAAARMFRDIESMLIKH